MVELDIHRVIQGPASGRHIGSSPIAASNSDNMTDHYFELLKENKKLKDSIKNLLGAVDTPVRRLKYPYNFLDEAIKIAKELIESSDDTFPCKNS